MSSDIAALYIKVDSKGVVTASRDLADLEKTSAKVEGTTKKVESATASANRSFMQMASVVKALAVSYGALKLSQYIKDATMLAARYEMLGVTMRVAGNTAGYTGAQMEKAAQGMQKMGISMIASRENAMKMVVAQLDLAKAADLARVAQDVARVANINSSEAFTRMIQGIRSGETEIFKTMGLMINMDKAYRDFEKTNNLVKGSIDAGQRAQAVMNAVLIEGEKYAGLYAATMDTAAGQTLSMQRHVENLKVAFGLAFTPALAEIIEQITGAVKDLNGELSGNSKDKITEWGTNFRIAIISVEAEIRRLAMLLDKLGGTMTSAQMLLYGPGKALGVKSSTERFDRAAAANMEYEARYKASEAALEALAKKQIELERSLTAEGKAAAKAAADAAESKVLAAQKATTATEKMVAADEKAIKATQKLREEWAKLKAELDFEKATAGMDDLDKALAEIERDMTKMRSNPNADLKLIDEVELQRQSTAIKAWYDEYLQEQIKAKENFERQEKAKQDSIAKGERETLDAIKKQYDADGQLLRDKLELYKDLEGFEDEYRKVQLDWIERIKNEEIKATGNITAAEKKAAKERAQIEYNLFKTKTDYIATGFGQLQSAFSDIAATYDEGSEAAKRWEQAAKAMEIAQKAVAVVQAVAAIATQGLGDPYTAFARIAAMAATMGALLATIGKSVGGAGGAGVASAPQYAFSNSVLGGEAGEESESLKKSWEFLEDTYDMEYEKLTKIHNELKSLNDNITGLVTSIIRTGSVGASFALPENIKYGEFVGFFDKMASIVSAEKLTGAIFGDSIIGKFLDLPAQIGTKWLAPVLNTIFGGGTEYWSGASGIGIGGGSAGGFQQGGGTSGYTWQDMYSKKDGGWFRSDEYRYWRQTASLDAGVVELFSKVYKNLSDTLVELTIGLGQDITKTLAYVFPGGTLALNGLSAEQISETLTNYFSAQADAAVQTLFGSLLKGYQEVGESLTDTAVRLMVDKEIVLEVLEQTNQAYSGSTDNAIALSEALINLAGDLETLTDISASYYDKFFSDEEKHLRLQEQLTTIFGALNIALPDTREAYRAVVESLDLTTASGQTAYITLLKLADGADIYYSTLEDMADDLVSAAELAAQAIKEVLDATNTAISEQISLAGAAASAARSAANEYRNIIKSLTDAQESIRGGSAAEMQQRFESLFATAMTGDREALSALPGAADKALAGSLASSKSAVDYARDQGKMLLALEQAKTISAAMVDWNEYHATLLETQVNVLEQIRDELALENPNLEALERQAGLLESIGGLLQQQTTAIVNGNGEQALLMIDQTGKIVLANKLTTDQTGKITLGNSWLSGIASGTSAQLIADATTSVTAHNDSEVIKQQIATGSLNITTSQAVNAAEIGKSLTTAQVALIDNNRVEAQQARAAMAMLEQTTKDGLITTAEAKATTDAIAALRNSTSNLLSQEILATNKAVSETITQADKAVQATLQVRTAVTSGAEFSAETIGAYLAEVEASLVDNNSKEAVNARKAIEALKVATADGLIKTAEAKATQDAITVLQNVTTGILSQGVKLSQSSLSEAAAQAATALNATMGVQETIKYGSKFSADTVGAYLTETETALIGNNSAEAAKAREAITLLKTITSEGLIKTADAATTKAAIAALQASTSTILNQSLTAQQAAYLSDTVQMAEAIAKTEKVSTAVTSGAAFSAAQIGEYLTGVETTLKDNNTKEAQAARDAIAQLRGVTADGFIATAEAETTTGALSSLQTATASLLKQALDLDNRALSDAAKQAASALDEAIKIEASIGASAAASINEMQKHLTAASNALAGNNSDEAMKARAAIATLQTTTKDGFISTAEAKTTTAAITTLQSSTANLLAQEVQAQQATMFAASKQAAEAVLATSKVQAAIAAGVNINSAVTIGNYLNQVKTALTANNSAEANQARAAIAELKVATSSGLASTATASATVAALNTLKSTTATILNQSVALEQSAMSAAANQASNALSAALATKDLINLQKAEIINGNLIIRDQNGLIVSGNQLLVDQTGKITIGNALTDEQTTQVMSGNATQDAIKNIQNLNTAYSEEMLAALIAGESTQTNSLQGILAANNTTVSLIGQLVSLTQASEEARVQAEADAAAARIAAEEEQRQAAETARIAAETAAAAAALAAQVKAATATYNQQAATAESYRAQWDQFATSHASASFRETQEDITKGQAYSVTGYYSYSDAERAWLSQTAAAYQNAFSEAYKLWKAIPGHASGLSFVPQDNYLMKAHEGEAVLTKQEAVEWRNRKSGVTLYTESNAALLAEIKKLNAKIDRLEAISYQTTKNTQKTAKTLEKFDYDGLPAERAA